MKNLHLFILLLPAFWACENVNEDNIASNSKSTINRKQADTQPYTTLSIINAPENLSQSAMTALLEQEGDKSINIHAQIASIFPSEVVLTHWEAIHRKSQTYLQGKLQDVNYPKRLSLIAHKVLLGYISPQQVLNTSLRQAAAYYMQELDRTHQYHSAFVASLSLLKGYLSVQLLRDMTTRAIQTRRQILIASRETIAEADAYIIQNPGLPSLQNTALSLVVVSGADQQREIEVLEAFLASL